jgi:signal transduction histidine kinase
MAQRAEVLVSLARRMQSFAHREIELLDQLESKVEDPELLKGLFAVDHLATRMRRQAESLAVLGGSASRRQWTRSVPMQEVLRAAAAEVEQYSRVRVVPPNDGVVRGAAVADVIHLAAELMENATKFAPPETSALVRAQYVPNGVAIEIEDRGLGILPADQARLNQLLADPGQVDLDDVLRGGHIGLYVVALLARRHGIRVRLQNNIYSGTQAVVVVPKSLLDENYGAHAAPSGFAAPPAQPDAWAATGGASGPHRSMLPGWAPPGSAPEPTARPPLPTRDVMASAPQHEREPGERERGAGHNAGNSTELDLPDDHAGR